jgi:hypothetical protein
MLVFEGARGGPRLRIGVSYGPFIRVFGAKQY